MGQAPSAFQVTSSSALPESRKSIRRSKTRRSTRSLPSTQCVSRNHLMQHNEPKGRSCKDCGLVDPTANLPLNLITSDNWVRNAAPYYVETKLKTVSGPRSLDLSLRRHVDKVNTCSRFQRNVQRGDSWSEVASDMYRFTRNSHPRCCRLKTNVEERRKCSRPLREESLMRPSSQNSSVCSRNSTSIAAVSKRASQPASSINHRPPKNVGQTEMQWSYNGLTPSIPHTQISQGHSTNAVSSSRTTSCEKVIIQSLRSELSAERSLRSENDRSVQLLSNDLRTLKAQLAALNKQLENAKTQTVLLNENSEKCTAECIQWEMKAKDLQKLVASLRAELTCSENAKERLRLEQQSQLVFYEKCLDEIANRMAEALVEHEVLKQECCRLRTRAMQLENERRKEQNTLLECRSAALDHAEFSSSESFLRRPGSKDIGKSLNSLLPPDTTAGEALCSRPVSFNIEVIDDLAACSKPSLENISSVVAFSRSRGMEASVEILADESRFNQVSSGMESSCNQAIQMHSPVKQFFNCCSCQLFSSVRLPLSPEVSPGDASNSKMRSSIGFFYEKLPYSGSCKGTTDGFQVNKNEEISSNGHFNSLSAKSLKLELVINMLRAANFESSSVQFSDRLSRRGIRSYDGRDVLTVPAVSVGRHCNLFDDGCSTISGDIWAELGIPFFSALRSSAGIAAKSQNGQFFGGKLRSSLKKRQSKSCGNFYFSPSDWPEPALQRQSSYPTYYKKYKQNLRNVFCKHNFMFEASTTPCTTITSNADLLQIPSDCIEALFSMPGDCSKVISDFSVLVCGKSQQAKSVSSTDKDQLGHKDESGGISEVKNLNEDAAAPDGVKLLSLKKEEELYDTFDMPFFKDDLMSTTTSSSFSSDESDREMHTIAEWLKQLKLKKGHQKFGVVRYLPREFRPSILRRDVFCRFGHQERDALACFDFLADVLNLSNQLSDYQRTPRSSYTMNCPSGSTKRKRSTADFNQVCSSAVQKRSRSLNDLQSTTSRSIFSSGLTTSSVCSKQKMRYVYDYCGVQKPSFGSLCSSPSYCSSSFLSEVCAEQTCSSSSSISFNLG